MTCCPLPLLVAVLVVFVGTAATADDHREVFETDIEAPISEVWKAFTTSERLQKWMAPVVEIELAVGGKMKSNYNPDGKIGDDTTIENTILSFDPERMLSMKATGFPKGFPFVEAAATSWTVVYFTELPSSRTRITVVGLGYIDTDQSQQMRSFFAVANKQLLDKLNSTLRQQAQP